jgi:hypothetical protein
MSGLDLQLDLRLALIIKKPATAGFFIYAMIA